MFRKSDKVQAESSHAYIVLYCTSYQQWVKDVQPLGRPALDSTAWPGVFLPASTAFRHVNFKCIAAADKELHESWLSTPSKTNPKGNQMYWYRTWCRGTTNTLINPGHLRHCLVWWKAAKQCQIWTVESVTWFGPLFSCWSDHTCQCIFWISVHYTN